MNVSLIGAGYAGFVTANHLANLIDIASYCVDA
jgi:UDP-glucose 6-dehydrogenase